MFMTQGLDLAIPDPRVYLQKSRDNLPDVVVGTDIASALKTCPQSLDKTKLEFDEVSANSSFWCLNASHRRSQTVLVVSSE